MDGQTDRQTDRQMDGRMDGCSLQGLIYLQEGYSTVDFRWFIHKSPTGVVAHEQV